MDGAKQRLILARQAHPDSLLDKLSEQRVIEPLLAGELPDADDTYNDGAA